ncbi:hypothetical protein [Mucilaginibacter sp. OK098]|uniref:hypothetical protein n=1 Tax=Mucilaginibacter sp. OK098 TaxID=1855297 RepID=UPI000922EDE1|nr:hypothetical protein [Mucilaginibacter sp. OK098]SHL98564.1 hypothetical protein SAMN05216524_101419 [Mucilaginibacter sp. OK098]
MNLRLKLYPLSALLMIGIAFLASCDAIIEPSISKKQVILEAPADQYQSSSYSINFWWDEVEHALSYRLQVVSQSFASPGGLVLDTVVTKNRFSFTLDPGKYQWRVLAQNGSSQTAFANPRDLEVEASSIKLQTVQLNSPANNLITNQSVQTFQWGSLFGATKYRFEIDTNNFSNESTILSNQIIPGQQLNYTFPKDQSYQWRVRAENDTAQSRWSAINSIIYDHTPPAVPALVSPTNGQTVSLPVTLQWGAVTTAVRYKLYVFKSDSTSLYNTSFPLSVTTTSYSFNLGSPGDKIYWKVSALDAAGNEGQASELRSFVLQ